MDSDGEHEVIDISDDDGDDDNPQQVSVPQPLSRIFPCGIWEILMPEGVVDGVAEWVGARILVDHRVLQGRMWLKPYLRQWLDMGVALPSKLYTSESSGGRAGRKRKKGCRKNAVPGEGSEVGGTGPARADCGNFWERYAAFEAACEVGGREARSQDGQAGRDRAAPVAEEGGDNEEELHEWIERSEAVQSDWTRGRRAKQSQEGSEEGGRATCREETGESSEEQLQQG